MDSGRKKQNVKEVPWKEHAPYVMEMQYYYACGRLWFMMSRRALSQVRLINLAILCRSWAVEFYANVVVLQFCNATSSEERVQTYITTEII